MGKSVCLPFQGTPHLPLATHNTLFTGNVPKHGTLRWSANQTPKRSNEAAELVELDADSVCSEVPQPAQNAVKCCKMRQNAPQRPRDSHRFAGGMAACKRSCNTASRPACTALRCAATRRDSSPLSYSSRKRASMCRTHMSLSPAPAIPQTLLSHASRLSLLSHASPLSFLVMLRPPSLLSHAWPLSVPSQSTAGAVDAPCRAYPPSSGLPSQSWLPLLARLSGTCLHARHPVNMYLISDIIMYFKCLF